MKSNGLFILMVENFSNKMIQNSSRSHLIVTGSDFWNSFQDRTSNKFTKFHFALPSSLSISIMLEERRATFSSETETLALFNSKQTKRLLR